MALRPYIVIETDEVKDRTILSTPNLEQNSSHASLGEEETQRLDTPVSIVVTSYRRRKHDTDGISVKAVLDGLVRCGILPDDSTDQIKEITFKSVISKEEKTIIEISNEE